MADIDTLAEIDGSGVISIDLTFTVGNNPNRALAAGTTWRQTGITLVSFTGAGATWSSTGARIDQNNQCAHTYQGIAPNTGSQTITATYSDSFGANQHVGCYSCFDADQTAPVTDQTNFTADSTAPSVSVPNVGTSDLVVDFVRTLGFGTITEGPDQTLAWDNPQAVGEALGSYQSGADGGVMSWSWSTTGDTVQIGLRIVNAAAADTLMAQVMM